MLKGRRHKDATNLSGIHKQTPISTAENSIALSVTVVFTTVPETLIALRRAAVLAQELGATIRIFVPYVVPYALPLERPPADPHFKIRKFRTLCEQQSIDTHIDVKLCRDPCQCLLRELAPNSVVLIGSERRSLFGASPRLVKPLQDAGHHVLLARDFSNAARGRARRSEKPAAFNRLRLGVIASFLAINSSCAVASTMRHQYPIGAAAVFFLIPALLRELDLKNGQSPRPLGLLGWSFLVAGICLLIVLPFIRR